MDAAAWQEMQDQLDYAETVAGIRKGLTQARAGEGTEAGQFQEAGYSAIVCGPGDIAQAHQPDEFLEISEFEAGQRFMERLLAECA